MAHWLSLPFAFLLGFIVTLQAALNRDTMVKRGLVTTVFVNNLVVFIVSSGLLAGAWWLSKRAATPLIAELETPAPVPLWQWVLPGLFGLAFVLGVPYAIREFGALRVTLGVMAGQIAMSLIWDAVKEGVPLSASRVGGVALVAVGAWLASRG